VGEIPGPIPLDQEPDEGDCYDGDMELLNLLGIGTRRTSTNQGEIIEGTDLSDKEIEDFIKGKNIGK
jgi:hypothetical protein